MPVVEEEKVCGVQEEQEAGRQTMCVRVVVGYGGTSIGSLTIDKIPTLTFSALDEIADIGSKVERVEGPNGEMFKNGVVAIHILNFEALAVLEHQVARMRRIMEGKTGEELDPKVIPDVLQAS